MDGCKDQPRPSSSYGRSDSQPAYGRVQSRGRQCGRLTAEAAGGAHSQPSAERRQHQGQSGQGKLKVLYV